MSSRWHPSWVSLVVSLLCVGCIRNDIVMSGGQLAVVVRDFADDPGTNEVALERVTLTRQSEIELRQTMLILPTNRTTTMGALVQQCLATRAHSAGGRDCELSGAASVGTEIDWAATAGIWAGAGIATAVLGALVGLLIHNTAESGGD